LFSQDINKHIADGTTGRMHREYTHLLTPDNHIRDDRAFGLFANSLADAIGLEWCGEEIEAACPDSMTAMAAAEHAALLMPVVVRGNTDGKQALRFFEVKRQASEADFEVVGREFLDAVGAPATPESFGVLAGMAAGLFGSRWRPVLGG
jgi:hypothetical protein